MTAVVAIALSSVLAGPAAMAVQDKPKNSWEAQYRTRTPEAMAAQFESATRPVFRYRVAIAGLLELKPGMVAADIGAGSGFLARVMAGQVGPTGKVIATELNPRMRRKSWLSPPRPALSVSTKPRSFPDNTQSDSGSPEPQPQTRHPPSAISRPES